MYCMHMRVRVTASQLDQLSQNNNNNNDSLEKYCGTKNCAYTRIYGLAFNVLSVHIDCCYIPSLQ